ncbi:hypothetical protein D5F01_LYC13959 [Larimichthys crocea]|uniref:Uncharacterized protein n=1 Tax=Larimichthys crocea TaxID=215358 RepID=A0A6G0I9E9_LARCR|nr:hypothetical protein D5F01_LYC13959 [Larimichthys crocea]
MDFSSPHSPYLPPASPLLGFTDKMEALVNAGIKFSLRSLTRHLPPPRQSTFCDTNLADNENDKKRQRLSPARADETDKASKVTQSYHLHEKTFFVLEPHQAHLQYTNMNGLFFLFCCAEILSALLCGAEPQSTNSSPSATESLTNLTSFSTSMTEASTAMSSTHRANTKVTSKSPTTPSVTQTTASPNFFQGMKECLPVFMVSGGLMVVCTILLVSTLLLACKVCHLARHIKNLSSNSDLISNTEYWMGTDKKGKSKSEAEPKETTVMMADINETQAETNGTKEEGGKVTEEGQMGEENKEEVGRRRGGFS